MKKFVASLIAVTMIATPALAEARHGHRYNDYGHGRHYDRHRDRGVSTGAAVAIGLGALILGGAIANSNRRNEYYQPQYQPQQQYQPQYVCQNEYVRDYNGNYILDSYGRAIFTQRCWYQ